MSAIKGDKIFDIGEVVLVFVRKGMKAYSFLQMLKHHLQFFGITYLQKIKTPAPFLTLPICW
jgi:hypothetical protein